MMKMRPTKLKDVVLIEPDVFLDERGSFLELFNLGKYGTPLNSYKWVQDNLSKSKKGVIRGLHLQWPKAQGKLVSVPYGAVFDVAVDVRKGSPTFGQWVGEILDNSSCRQLWIPPGFAHGFQALTDIAIVHYKCSENVWLPENEQVIFYGDKDIDIVWPLASTDINERDKFAPRLCNCANLPSPAEL